MVVFGNTYFVFKYRKLNILCFYDILLNMNTKENYCSHVFTLSNYLIL